MSVGCRGLQENLGFKDEQVSQTEILLKICLRHPFNVSLMGGGGLIIRACAVTPTGETAMTITRVCSQFAFAVAYIDRLASSQKLIDLLKLNTTLFLLIFLQLIIH